MPNPPTTRHAELSELPVASPVFQELQHFDRITASIPLISEHPCSHVAVLRTTPKQQRAETVAAPLSGEPPHVPPETVRVVFKIKIQLGPCVISLSRTPWTASARGIFAQRMCSVASRL